jgi:hypothetical protein
MLLNLAYAHKFVWFHQKKTQRTLTMRFEVTLDFLQDVVHIKCH